MKRTLILSLVLGIGIHEFVHAAADIDCRPFLSTDDINKALGHQESMKFYFNDKYEASSKFCSYVTALGKHIDFSVTLLHGEKEWTSSRDFSTKAFHGKILSGIGTEAVLGGLDQNSLEFLSTNRKYKVTISVSDIGRDFQNKALQEHMRQELARTIDRNLSKK